MNIAKFEWKFKSLPFVYRELESPNNDLGIPNVLPFKLTVDSSNGVLTQVNDKVVGDTLDKAYSLGSVIAGVIDDENDNLSYSDDFIDFFKDSVSERKLKVLEIGSGTGFLLSQIKKLDFDVIGIEPGKHCLKAKEKYGVDIIHDFFPSKHIDTQFDIIVMTNVLEHIPNPSLFLNSLHAYLKENGKLIISVPDEEPFIKYGDISTLFHEHYSYFTKDTINNTLKSGGFKSVKERFGKYGGVLLLAAIKSDNTLSKEEITLGYNLAEKYKSKAELYGEKLKSFLNGIKNKNQTLGVYVPSRFINTLHISNIKEIKIRFFDDNPSLIKKYYPGFDIPIENKHDLIAKPVDVLLIFSKAFGNKIKSNLQSVIDPSVEIVTWEELFNV
ncbi:class I SAM-dependent methyltransferase [Aliarcobacter butzleri]|uniref:class I SAM-dependent methyltransferase n=1 Tax=Aliarcobacter butzleri TaxID=28197 RepID=UPI002B24ABCC|nr:class I SAM-dependent methyltransferase [Aliarcobacter butzleri]